MSGIAIVIALICLVLAVEVVVKLNLKKKLESIDGLCGTGKASEDSNVIAFLGDR